MKNVSAAAIEACWREVRRAPPRGWGGRGRAVLGAESAALDVFRAVPVGLLDEEEDPVRREQAAAVESQPLACPRVEDQQAQVGARREVVRERIARCRPRREAQELLVHGRHEARRPGQHGRPDAPARLEARGHCDPMAGEEPRGLGRQTTPDDAPHGTRLVENPGPPLHLQLAGMERRVHEAC